MPKGRAKMCSGNAQVFRGLYKKREVQCCAKRAKGRGAFVSCHLVDPAANRAARMRFGAKWAANINRGRFNVPNPSRINHGRGSGLTNRLLAPRDGD